MSVRWLTIVFCLLANAGWAQGFAGLGAASDDFAQPEPRAFVFPQDHGAHPDFRIEWWYITANLTDADGVPMGIQWTLFRSARALADAGSWQSAQAWMGHAAVTTPDDHRVSERLARGGTGQAGVQTTPFSAWIDDWAFEGDDGWQSMALRASGASFNYDLNLTAGGPLVAHGDNGFSVKSEAGQASRYYSQTRFQVTGTITLDNTVHEVTGRAWLDREWSSQPLEGTQTGWDWFSLSFDDGHQLMAFALREGTSRGFSSGTWIRPDGQAEPFGNGVIDLTPLGTSQVAGRDVPTRWRLEMPSRDMDVTVEALNDQAWMNTLFPYWEGPVTVTGSHTGRGYLEMTGYEARQ